MAGDDNDDRTPLGVMPFTLEHVEPPVQSLALPHGTRFSIRAWMPELRNVYQRLLWRGETTFCAPYLGEIDDAMAALGASANTIVRLGLSPYPRGMDREAHLDALIEATGYHDRAALDARLRRFPVDPGPAFIPQPLPRSEFLGLKTDGDPLSAMADLGYLHDKLVASLGIPKEFLRFPEPGTPAAEQWMTLFERGLRMERELDFSPIAPLEPDEPEPKG